MIFRHFFAGLAIITVTFSCQKSKITPENQFNSAINYGELADVDGNTYKTLEIGTQTWMAENLQVTRFKNGAFILKATSAKEWADAYRQGKPAWCYYSFNEKLSAYGKLYNWHTIVSQNGLAPDGWRIPSDTDWQVLVSNFNHLEKPSLVCKSQTGWLKNYVGNNQSGFSALGSGRLTSIGTSGSTSFEGFHAQCYWWTTTEAIDLSMFAWYLTSASESISNCCLTGTSGFNKASGFYVRLVKED